MDSTFILSLDKGIMYEDKDEGGIIISPGIMYEDKDEGIIISPGIMYEDEDEGIIFSPGIMYEDEDEANDRRRNGKGPQCKNLVAERKRRKKLNDRLYQLRSLVPNISKLDKASIIGDAIDYVMELRKEVSDLQNELEEHSEDDENSNNTTPNYSAVQYEVVQENIGNHKVQQMEPQVEVSQLDGNEFFVKVFCEHKAGGFVKLTEALNSLGLEVTNVNVTSFRSLVVNVFKVEKEDSEVQADHVRESLLLELTRNFSENSSIDHGRHHHHPFIHNHPQPYQHNHRRHIHHLHN